MNSLNSISSIQSGPSQLTRVNTSSNPILDEVLRTVQTGDVEGFNKLATEKFDDLFSLHRRGVFPYEELVKQGDPRYLAILQRKGFPLETLCHVENPLRTLLYNIEKKKFLNF